MHVKASQKCFLDREDSRFSDNENASSAPQPVMLQTIVNFTMKEPRSRDSRFRHTGRRISMQLKLRTAAGALAQDKADWNTTHTFIISRKAMRSTCTFLRFTICSQLTENTFYSAASICQIDTAVGFHFPIFYVCKLLVVPPISDFLHGFV